MHSNSSSLEKLFTVFLVGVLAVIVLFEYPRAASAASVNPWWPTNGAHVSGLQPFKAEIQGVPVDQYQMYWQVDGGGLVTMDSNYTGYPHKEASVDVTSWGWHGAGPYTVTFVAKQNGSIVAQQSVTMYNDGYVASIPSSAVSSPSSTSVAAVSTNKNDSPPGMTLWVNPNSSAASQASAWSSSNPNDAQLMKIIAAQPTAQWLGGWSGDIYSATHDAVMRAQSADAVPVLIAYNIPARDCGGYSAGGVGSASAYNSWIQSFAAGIGSARTIVILEPDALATISCLSSADAQTRLSLLANAVGTLKNNANTKVYIDAGHSGWVDAGIMASRLRSANISRADGFALNVSNFQATDAETSYGTQISQNLGGKHFVIDTSRNGLGSNGEWCNPQGRAIGIKPTTNTGNSLIDAYLWIKVPGESDGNCNGGPSAGTWWPSYALGLAQRGQ